MRHILARYISPRELNALLSNVDRIKFISKLARRKIDHIEFLGFFIHHLMRNKDLRNTLFKRFQRTKYKFRDLKQKEKRKMLIIEKTAINMKEIFNLSYEPEEIQTYYKILNN